MSQPFTLAAVVHSGRLEYEALLLAESSAATGVRLTLVEPQPGPLWPFDPRAGHGVRARLLELGAEILPFESRHFGAGYPQGNRIEALAALPDSPFVFLDTDTLLLRPLTEVPFDFDRPTGSSRCEGTWPKPSERGMEAVWRAVYATIGADLDPHLADLPAEDWRRYPYFNAGLIFGRDPARFGALWLEAALALDALPELAGQPLLPWRDQASLPAVIAKLGGGRATLPPGLIDGAVTCHYRTLPLLYARESDAAVAALEAAAAPNRTKKLLKDWEPARRMIFRGEGRKVRDALLGRKWGEEAELRRALRARGWWLR